MGHKPTFRAGVALLAVIQCLSVQAQPPATPPELNVTSGLVRTLGMRLENYDAMADIKYDGCVKELSRLRETTIASVNGQPLSIGAAASLYYIGGDLRSGDPSKVPDWAKAQVEPVNSGVIRQTREFFDRGIQSQDPVAYRRLEADLNRVGQVLEAQARELGTAEARAAAEGFSRLQNKVAHARNTATTLADTAVKYPQHYPGAGQLFKQTAAILDTELPAVARLLAQAEVAAAASAVEGTVRSAQLEVAGASGARGGKPDAAKPAESAPKPTGEGVPGAAGRSVLMSNWVLGLLTLASVGLQAFDSPERSSKRYAEQGVKVAESWKVQPDATDTYVFGPKVEEVCARAVKDPDGFGKVVSQKLSVVEWFRKVRQVIEVEKMLNPMQNLMADGSSTINTHVAIFEGSGKRLGGESFRIDDCGPGCDGTDGKSSSMAI